MISITKLRAKFHQARTQAKYEMLVLKACWRCLQAYKRMEPEASLANTMVYVGKPFARNPFFDEPAAVEFPRPLCDCAACSAAKASRDLFGKQRTGAKFDA